MLRQIKVAMMAATAVVCLFSTTQLSAMPVNPEPQLLVQPNGSTIAAMPKGDEKILWFEALDTGDILVKNPITNFYEYADINYLPTGNELISSGYIYGWAPLFDIPQFSYQDLMDAWKSAWENADDGHEHAAAPAPAGSGGSGGSQGGSAAPTPGQWVYDSLFIMVEFTDYQFVDSPSVWSDKIFGGYPNAIQAGSVNDYYQEITQGGLFFTPANETQGTTNDGFIKVQLPVAHPQHARNFSTWRPTLEDAFAAATAHIDFSQYDVDGNGTVGKEELLISFIVAGRESSYNGSETEGFWGHAYFSNNFGTYNGVQVSTGYMGFGERQGPANDDYNSTIGIITHELGHSAFNLRDLYNSPTAISYWGLMGTGSWGYSEIDGDRLGERPVHMTAMSKMNAYLKDNSFGFYDPTVVTPTTTAQQITTAHPFGTADYEFFQIPGETSNKYWLVEQRKVEGYDRGLIRNGAISDNPQAGDTGVLVSYRESASRLWIKRFNGQSAGTRVTDMLYSGNVTEFTPGSTYSSNYPDTGNFSGLEITSVSAPMDQMTAMVSLEEEPPFTCVEHTDNVAAHETAGRVYSVTEGQTCYTFGCFGGTTVYYTTGADESLGSFYVPTYTSITLAETAQDYYISGSCPAGDFVAPVITLNGSANETVYQNSNWTDPGATASDNVDGNLTSSIVVTGDTVNTAVIGTYTIRYNVSDAAGNNATEVTREVNVVADWVPPSITLSGSATMSVALGGTYTEPGYSATDNVDGDITANVVVGGDTVNTSIEGTYVITYNVSDAAGNPASEVTRTVNVVEEQDTTPPTITLTGSSSITLTVGDSYSEPGYSATDDTDGDITANVVVGGHVVDPNTVGTYVVTYNVSDAAGNPATEVTRTVIVEAAGGACFSSTLADHESAGRVQILYGSLYYTVVTSGSAEYLGSTYVNSGTVVDLEEQSAGHWVTSSCN